MVLNSPSHRQSVLMVIGVAIVRLTDSEAFFCVIMHCDKGNLDSQSSSPCNQENFEYCCDVEDQNSKDLLMIHRDDFTAYRIKYVAESFQDCNFRTDRDDHQRDGSKIQDSYRGDEAQ
ncbi:uncharacterized protein FPRO_11092 [Fusarium proliferatum ET1]|uniref:Uncharacterized protein n=1 Tax=Fusarium proliferatum (strain ET1) TaxID=1227346 RepID=A0A1L7VLW3_FUSPR|nr:uncharacterized protein FPRO_11092 [Fusarium proliferatum ET1]CVK97953.1 uncharacterized protein FPRN_10689 [Fusarium proliferatum]CZR41503.1 uncharacterized protein FPRO_11092 [Fusarium proliferatum ET1]